MADAGTPLLRVSGLQAGYGAARVLHGIDFDLHAGETLVVIGRNGVGKTTLIETLMGLTTLHGGRIVFDDRAIEREPSHRRNRLGIAWVPQQREVFVSLTVEENLSVVARPGRWDLHAAFRLFPRLGERRANYGDQLSGGEQQMLAMARALVTNPRLLLLDEPVEGLAPRVVDEMFEAIARMQADGEMALLLVEQKHELALLHSDRCIVLDHGTIRHHDRSETIRKNPELLGRLVGLEA